MSAYRTGIFLILLVLGTLVSPGVRAETRVEGRLFGEVVWTREGSPYLVTGDVIVDSNAALIIEAGVTVRFELVHSSSFQGVSSMAELIVEGTLSACGTRAEPVHFRPEAYRAIGDWGGILVAGGSAYLANVVIEYAEYALFVDSGEASVSSTVLKSNIDGIVVGPGGEVTVTDSTVKWSSSGVSNRGDLRLDGSLVKENSYGVYLDGSNSAMLKGNRVTGNTFGVYVRHGTGVEVMEGNEFSIPANSFAIHVDSGTVERISENDFLLDYPLPDDPFRELWYVVNEGTEDVDCRYNWWGSTDERLIAAFIYDHHDDPSRGEVVFVPYLAGPVGEDEVTKPVPDGEDDDPSDHFEGEFLSRTYSGGLHLAGIPSADVEITGVNAAAGTLRAWAWLGGEYALVGEGELDTVAGALWLEVEGTVVLEGRLRDSAPSQVHIPLSPGWNALTGPFLDRVDLSEVRVETQKGKRMTLAEAEASGLVDVVLWTLQSGEYTFASELRPWTGYWIRAYEQCSLLVGR